MTQAAAMYHFGRCGSTVLCRMLSRHPEVSWHGEFYLGVFQDWAKRFGGEVVGEMPEDPINMLSDAMDEDDDGLFFFEFKTWHARLIGMTLDEFVSEAAGLGTDRHIVLERENRLRIIVSILVAHHRGRYHNKGGRARLTRVHVPVDEPIHADFEQKPLVEFMRGYDEQLENLWAALDKRRTLHITYEADIRDGPQKGYEKCCRFLGLEPRDEEPDLNRTNPFPLEEIIVNYDEVAEELKNTRWEWMLDG